MKNLVMWLGCGLLALAIGCSEGGGTGPTPSAPMPNSADYQKMMQNSGAAGAAAGDATAEKKEEAAEKKEEAAEKKEEAAEKKEEAAEKKEEAAEKKEEATEKKE